MTATSYRPRRAEQPLTHKYDHASREYERIARFLFVDEREPASELQKVACQSRAKELAEVIVEVEARGQDPRDPDTLVQWLELRSPNQSTGIRQKLWEAVVSIDYHDCPGVPEFFSDWSRRYRDMREYEQHATNLKMYRQTEFNLTGVLSIMFGPEVDARFVPDYEN